MSGSLTDRFGVEPAGPAEDGALDASLTNDLPLFLDPFLPFTSQKPEYQRLRDRIIN